MVHKLKQLLNHTQYTIHKDAFDTGADFLFMFFQEIIIKQKKKEKKNFIALFEF